MDELPMPDFLFNALGVGFSLMAMYYWVKLYKRIYRKKNEFRGWAWLFASAFAILLLNLSSTYLLFAQAKIIVGFPYDVTVDFNKFQVLEVLSRTIIVFAMTVGVYLIYAPLKTGFIYDLAPVGLSGRDIRKKQGKNVLNASMSYLLPERGPSEPMSGLASSDRSSLNSMRVFVDTVATGVYGLIVTRENPLSLRKNWEVGNIPVIWLTTSRDVELISNVQFIDPVDLVGLSHAIKDFIRNTDDTVILLDCLEYLITQNNFNDILKFLQSLDDFVIQKKTRMLVPLDYKAVDERQLHLLKRELCEINVF